MEGRIFSGFKPKGYSVLGIALLSLLLRLPVTSASRVLCAASDSSFENRTSLKNTTNWILHLLNECYVAESPLIIAGNLSEKITSRIYRSTKTTLVLFTKSETSLDQAYARSKWTKGFYEKGFSRLQHKAKIFLVAASSKPILRHLIKQLRTSRWWNSSGLYLILDEELEKSRCINAYSYLSTAWMNGLVSVVYLCLKNNAEILVLYSYNPFEDQAPRPYWKTIASYGTGRNGHPWTLFRRELDLANLKSSKVDKFSGKSHCDKIFFDKTRNLNGYPVRINAVNFNPRLVYRTETNISGLAKYSGEDGWLAQTLWGWLNATIIEMPETNRSFMGFTDEDDIEHGLEVDLKTGRVDMTLNQRYISLSRNLEGTYPHTCSSYCFLTKSQGVLPLWKNMLNGASPLLTFLVIFFILTLIPLLVSLEDKKYTSTLFNVLRMLAFAPMVQLPRQFSSRFLVAGTLFLIEISNGIFQGQIASMVTKPSQYNDIDTQDDLDKSGYRIHGFVAFEKIIPKLQLRQRYVTSEIEEMCFEMAMGDMPVACASDCMKLLVFTANRSELHIAQEPLISGYVHYITRIDWPLLGRVNQLLTRMVSAGLPHYWRGQMYRISIRNLALKKKLSSFGPRPIRFDDIDMLLYSLLGGLLIATAIFGVEVALFRWKNKSLRT